MIEFLSIAQSIVERGLIFSLIVAAVYITSRIIKFDDLTVEGSFGLGGAAMATSLIYGLHPLLGIIIAVIAGGLAGLATALLHTRLKLNNLISGIVITTGLFSISLKIGTSHKDLSGITTIFHMIPEYFMAYKELVFLTPCILIIILGLRWFLQTEFGFLLHAVGQNPQMLIKLRKNPEHYLIAALVLGNMLTALSGAFFVQYTGYFSIWANVGILIISLIGLMLAELISTQFGLALLFGAIVYQALITLTFELQIDQDWNKLINALLIIALMVFNQWKIKKMRKDTNA